MANKTVDGQENADHWQSYRNGRYNASHFTEGRIKMRAFRQMSVNDLERPQRRSRSGMYGVGIVIHPVRDVKPSWRRDYLD